ncbi:hypothetical protein B0J17DRAFT_616684 [Rhizoctonia solani]|nr:hypothetical protein B0J17DRAFT_616684 [Rhizoctonia solani]
MNKFMVARSFKENSSPLQLSGKQVFKVMFVAIFEYLTRFKEANITNPGICDFTEQIAEWFDQWVEALGSNPPFQDECTTYDTENLAFFIENLRRDKERVLRLVRRGQTVVVVNNEAQEAFEPPKDASPGLLAALERAFEYDGPGDLCEAGRPRHDNDYAEIDMIQVVPTRDELLCEADPYLPGNFFEAPHYYDPRSADRLLDIQFRLLREELMSQIRLAVQHIVDDLKQSRSGTRVLLQKLNPRSGIYATTGRDSVRFSVFTGVTFQSLELAKRGISVGLEFDTPPGKAKSNNPASRGGYWDQLTKKRLSQDALVALIWKTPAGKVDIYLGTVASSGRDLVNCARKNGGQNRLSISVSFFVAKANVRIVQALQNHRSNNDTCVLMEAPVFYEGIRPFLEGLKREPELLPFARYLRLQSRDELRQINIDPPLYSRTPGFSFELKHLFPPEANVESLRLNTGNLESIANVRARLQASRLDPSQAEAVVDSLTREVALIQGPPGTGKSYTGLELIRVLIKNNICPILLVAFTNHALDHMLNGILNAGITQNVIRLGSRFAANERLQPYLLETLGRQAGKSRLSASRKSATDQMKDLESQMKGLMDKISSHKVPSSHIEEHISYMYPHHYGELFRHTPSWIDAITPKPSETEEGWEIAGEPPNEEYSIIKFWRKGRDLDFLETQGQNGAAPETSAQVSSFNQFEVLLDSKSTGDEPETTTHQNFLRDFMREHGFKNVPKVPKTNRPVNLLQKNPGVWRMSRSERISLHKIWSIEAGDVTHESQIREFEKFRLAHKVASEQHKEISDQLKAEILSRSHIVGCTTTAAAKYTSLLSGMSPKVMIVEEAGQVLESHILAGLVKSLEHVILIGDPLQLRPNINCYGLATENADSGYIYKFDQSLMERLSSGGFPMSQIDVQRRMRPEISSLIRNTLYPKLQDNEQVQSYPNVRGMYKNMFFVSHTHKEAGGGDASVSKHNSFEVDMIYDLVLHLLKQGCYNKSGNIVVLTAYLGQIPKIRQKLQDIVTIVIDERDAELLDPHTIETEETSAVQQVELNKQVIIRTLDNFQGEEGEVIILSLVRNSGTALDEEMPSLEHIGKGPIGFLKNKNRTNVGLSRAKHGLYVFGNAPELAQGSKMWSDVLKEFHSTQCLGTKFPISCHRHPEYVKWIGNPGELAIASPNGGCCRPCAQALSCGHICPSLCHADDPNHISTKCKQPCTRLCPLMHPCDRECWECSTDSTNCRFPIVDLQLPCGHIHPPTQWQDPTRQKCQTRVEKELPFCEHRVLVPCHQDPATYFCSRPCGGALLCCSGTCSAKCGACHKLNPGEIIFGVRTKHTKHKCNRGMACGHPCNLPCREGHACSKICKGKCQQSCSHSNCRQKCSTVCKPCGESCVWKCVHMKCTSPCGMACTRLPCDEKCSETLSCGHPCPSVCGEPCDYQTCKTCNEDNLDSVVDLLKQTSLHDRKGNDALDSMTITLPCRHVLTVKALDDITRINAFYYRDAHGRWASPAMPPSTSNVRDRPVCPHCGGEIDSLRYGRVLKFSNHSILQNNIARNLSKRLSQAESMLSEVRSGIEATITTAVGSFGTANISVPSDTLRRSLIQRTDVAVAAEKGHPTSLDLVENLSKFHGFPPVHTKAWRKAVSEVMEPYRVAYDVTRETDPSARGYEKSLAQLYEEALRKSGGRTGPTTDPAQLRLQQDAADSAYTRIGHLPPRASKRFVVEAFWISIEILMVLGLTISRARETVQDQNERRANAICWDNVAKFFLLRASKDAETALAIAEESKSQSKVVRCQLLVLQTQYEHAAHQCRVAIRTRLLSNREVRGDYMDICARGIEKVQILQASVPRNYQGRVQRGSVIDMTTAKAEWVRKRFTRPTEKILEAWFNLNRLIQGRLQEDASAQRLISWKPIVQEAAASRRTWHAEYFYLCSRGHPYTRRECTVTLGKMCCPECGRIVGDQK